MLLEVSNVYLQTRYQREMRDSYVKPVAVRLSVSVRVLASGALPPPRRTPEIRGASRLMDDIEKAIKTSSCQCLLPW